MFAPYLSSFEQVYTNDDTPLNSPGGSYIPGASNAEGSWSAIATSGNIASDIYWIKLLVAAGATAANVKDHLLDIGVDPAGGSSYAAIISNIVCGQSGVATECGIWFMFPIFIKSGSSVAIRIQGSNGTAGTVRVAMVFLGKPSRPEMVRVGTFSETIGTITNSGGVAFTPGNAGAEGSWTSLGTTTNALWWWQVCVQISDSTTTNQTYHIDLAYGDGTNKVMIIENAKLLLPGSSERTSMPVNCFGYREVPAGSTIYIRGACSTTSDTSVNAVAIGIGG